MIIWMGDTVGGKEKLMEIQLQFKSIIVPLADMQDYPGMFSALQQYLPAQKTPKRRKPRKEKQTVAHLIDRLIDSIDSLE